MEKNICKLKDVYHMLQAIEKEFHEANGITVNEALVLCFLSKKETHTAGELCKHIGLSNSRVSKIINDMERKEYLVRRIGYTDKRQMFFVLTEAGHTKYGQIKDVKIDLNTIQAQIIACF